MVNANGRPVLSWPSNRHLKGAGCGALAAAWARCLSRLFGLRLTGPRHSVIAPFSAARKATNQEVRATPVLPPQQCPTATVALPSLPTALRLSALACAFSFTALRLSASALVALRLSAAALLAESARALAIFRLSALALVALRLSATAFSAESARLSPVLPPAERPSLWPWPFLRLCLSSRPAPWPFLRLYLPSRLWP